MVNVTDFHPPSLFYLYEVFGWSAFAVWSISFWPQVYLNFKRKSVVGLNFDFVGFNLTKHSCYMLFNLLIFFDATTQHQYLSFFNSTDVPVAVNDVVFSLHAVAVTLLTVIQCFIYERGGQKMSKAAIIILSVAWGTILVNLMLSIFKVTGWTLFIGKAFGVNLPFPNWLWFVEYLNLVQLLFTFIKYAPQAIMNFRRKCTVGWSIGNILMDFSGGVFNLLQLFMQAIGMNEWSVFTGDFGKLGLSIESILFDILFIVQHYCLYREKNLEVARTEASMRTAGAATKAKSVLSGEEAPLLSEEKEGKIELP